MVKLLSSQHLVEILALSKWELGWGEGRQVIGGHGAPVERLVGVDRDLGKHVAQLYWVSKRTTGDVMWGVENEHVKDVLCYGLTMGPGKEDKILLM